MTEGSRELKTLPEAMSDFGRSLREFQRVVGAQLLPTFERFNIELAKLRRELYLARLRRWIPYWFAALVLAIAFGWWFSG